MRAGAVKHVLPISWTEAGGRGSVGGIPAADLAARFGTPLVVVDERHLEARLAAFRSAFGPGAELTYAGKAFLCGALVRLLAREGWFVDVVSGGELELVAAAADFVAPLRDCFTETAELDLGGGLAAPYRADERVPSPRRYAEALRTGLREARASGSARTGSSSSPAAR